MKKPPKKMMISLGGFFVLGKTIVSIVNGISFLNSMIGFVLMQIDRSSIQL